VADRDEYPVSARSFVAPVRTSLIRAPVTPEASPSTSSSVWFHSTRMLPPSRVFAISLSTRIASARNLSRRCTTVTARDVGQIEGLFDRGIAAADDHHVLRLVEESVAGRAGRYALAHERVLRRQAEVARGAPVAMISASHV
jgi:hypothetical protein